MHRTRFSSAFFLLMGSPLILLAQQPEKKGSISGVILHSQTKEPLRNAEVTLMATGGMTSVSGSGTAAQPRSTTSSQATNTSSSGSSIGSSSGAAPKAGTAFPQQTSVVSDEEGKYYFSDVEAGSYIVMSTRKGFLPTRYGARHPYSPGHTRIAVSEGQDVTNIRIEMMPQSVLSGKVLDEEGEPFQGVMVQVVDMRMTGPSRPGMTFRRGGMGRADDRGEFRISDLPPGNYHLHVSPAPTAASLQVAGSADRKAYIPLFYPGTPDRAQAQEIQIAPGADVSGFQIRMQRSEVAMISGKVLGVDGQPATTPFMVNLMPKAALLTPFPAAGYRQLENGGFQLANVPPGSYSLNVQMQSPNGVRAMHQQDLDVGKDDIQDLHIQVKEPFSVSGQILLGKDAEQINPSTIQIRAWPTSGIFSGLPTARIEADGTFTLSNVYAGKHEIQVYFSPTAGYLESIRHGDQDITGQDVDITNEGTLRIRLDGNGGTVTGSVTSEGKPASGGIILVVPVKKELRNFLLMKMGNTDQDATFSVSQIAPGDYLVMALDSFDSALLQDEARMQELERKAKKISVKKGTAESVNLEMSETGI